MAYTSCRAQPDAMWSPQAASTWAEMFGPQVTDYGLGWWVGEFNGHPIIGNYGAESGFQSHLGIFPDEGYAVIQWSMPMIRRRGHSRL